MRHDFGSVNPEIRIIEGRIIEVLLYFHSSIEILATGDLVYFIHSSSWYLVPVLQYKWGRIDMYINIFVCHRINSHQSKISEEMRRGQRGASGNHRTGGRSMRVNSGRWLPSNVASILLCVSFQVILPLFVSIMTLGWQRHFYFSVWVTLNVVALDVTKQTQKRKVEKC